MVGAQSESPDSWHRVQPGVIAPARAAPAPPLRGFAGCAGCACCAMPLVLSLGSARGKALNARRWWRDQHASRPARHTFEDRFPAPQFSDRFPSERRACSGRTSGPVAETRRSARRRRRPRRPSPPRLDLALRRRYRVRQRDELTTLVSMKSSAFLYFGTNPRRRRARSSTSATGERREPPQPVPAASTGRTRPTMTAACWCTCRRVSTPPSPA